MIHGSISLVLSRNNLDLQKIDQHTKTRRLGRPHGTRHWTARNFLYHLEKLTDQRIAVIMLDLNFMNSKKGVYFDDKFYELNKILQLIYDTIKCNYIIVICTKGSEVPNSCFEPFGRKLLTSYCVHSSTSTTAVVFACEIYSWLSAGFCSNEGLVSIRLYLNAIDNLIAKLNDHHEAARIYSLRWFDPDRIDTILVPNFINREFYDVVDVEKLFQLGIRNEQVADTLKRVSDVNQIRRYPHSSSIESEFIAQANFIAAQVEQAIWDFDWFPSSSLAREFQVTSSPTRESTKYRRLNLRADQIRILAQYITQQEYALIGSGTYHIGFDGESRLSEPPSKFIAWEVMEFKISRKLVTNSIAQSAGIQFNSKVDSEMPWASVSAFCIMEICEAVTEYCLSTGLLEDGQIVRLPTEMEWEIAANGGARQHYPWGDGPDRARCNADMQIGHPTPVGMYSPTGDSAFGCSDMAGNVREWTCTYAGARGVDWTDLGQENTMRDLSNLSYDDRLIVRGGSYSYAFECVRTWVRNSQIACRADQQTGFRLVIARAQG